MANNSQDIAIFRNDLYIVDGDFAIAFSDQQHVSDTIAAFPGWWKQFPADGVGVLQYLNSSGREQELERSVRINLQSDGYRMSDADITNNNDLVIINPNAEKV